jgi:DNA-binding XRE family transcriptional regulator
MPATNGNEWRHRRAQLGITSDQAGELLGITGGALRSIETEFRPASLALAYRAARLYSCSVHDLIRGEDKPDPKKDEPKVEPKVEPTAPPRRNGKDDRQRPPRSADLKAVS